jgi:hypothetical protein
LEVERRRGCVKLAFGFAKPSSRFDDHFLKIRQTIAGNRNRLAHNRSAISGIIDTQHG